MFAYDWSRCLYYAIGSAECGRLLGGVGPPRGWPNDALSALPGEVDLGRLDLSKGSQSRPQKENMSKRSQSRRNRRNRQQPVLRDWHLLALRAVLTVMDWLLNGSGPR